VAVVVAVALRWGEQGAVVVLVEILVVEISEEAVRGPVVGEADQTQEI
jgi:hypothetical protein